MKKFVCMIVCFAASFILASTDVGSSKDKIADNFAPAGLLIDGSGSFVVDHDYSDYIKGTINGRVGFFLVRNLQIFIQIGYKGEKWKTYNDTSSYHSLTLPCNLGVEFFWGYDKEKSSGFAHSIGGAVKTGFKISWQNYFSGENIRKIKEPIYRPSFHYSLHYFITPTIAPHISAVYDEYHPLPDFLFGFTYFIPSSKRVLVHKKNL